MHLLQGETGRNKRKTITTCIWFGKLLNITFDFFCFLVGFTHKSAACHETVSLSLASMARDKLHKCYCEMGRRIVPLRYCSSNLRSQSILKFFKFSKFLRFSSPAKKVERSAKMRNCTRLKFHVANSALGAMAASGWILRQCLLRR